MDRWREEAEEEDDERRSRRSYRKKRNCRCSRPLWGSELRWLWLLSSSFSSSAFMIATSAPSLLKEEEQEERKAKGAQRGEQEKKRSTSAGGRRRGPTGGKKIDAFFLNKKKEQTPPRSLSLAIPSHSTHLKDEAADIGRPLPGAEAATEACLLLPLAKRLTGVGMMEDGLWSFLLLDRAQHKQKMLLFPPRFSLRSTDATLPLVR